MPFSLFDQTTQRSVQQRTCRLLEILVLLARGVVIVLGCRVVACCGRGQRWCLGKSCGIRRIRLSVLMGRMRRLFLQKDPCRNRWCRRGRLSKGQSLPLSLSATARTFRHETRERQIGNKGSGMPVRCRASQQQSDPDPGVRSSSGNQFSATSQSDIKRWNVDPECGLIVNATFRH